MPLRVVKRKDRAGRPTIVGTIRLKDGAAIRIRRRAGSDDVALAREEAAAIEADILRTDWHGERRGIRSLDEAIISYLKAVPRSENTKARLSRLRATIGGSTPLKRLDQDQVAELRKTRFADAAESTVLREAITPLRAILRHAAKRGWCDQPNFETPKVTDGRTLYMTPDEAERLLCAATPHVRPLLAFLIGTGARLSEAIYLDWRDVDLTGARAIFWETKNGKRRNANLTPSVVAGLACLGTRSGPVFRRPDGKPYADRGGMYGGQIKTAWRTASRRAGLNPDYTPHTCRHTWASWHYALHKDLLLLKQEGGWSSVALVERYAHLMPAGQEAAIREFLGSGAWREEMRA